MTRKHAKRRTIYNTEPGFDPVRHAIVGAGVMQVSMQNRLQVVELRALDAFKAGTATDMQLEIFAGMGNRIQGQIKEVQNMSNAVSDLLQRLEL